MRKYQDYDVWVKSHAFALKLYQATKSFPKDEMYGLRSQIRRAGVSIPTNIAEGAGRDGDKQFARFIDIAFASTNEAEYLLIFSHELDYISNPEYIILTEMVDEIKKMLASLFHRLKYPSNS